MKPSLVLLAAGMGSRYGGIKQLDSFGPSGERIIDYTLYDALRAGYEKIIFIIRRDIEADFREVILSKWEGKAEFHLVFQELDAIPDGYSVPEGRTKPWGTAHAVWMTREVVKEPFAIVNADDFYGYGSLKAAFDYLSTLSADQPGACLIGYELDKTITDSGSVSRGICESDSQGFLTGVTERTQIARDNEGIYFEEEGQRTRLEPKTIVSMNLMGFTPHVFDEIANGFDAIYQSALKNPKAEYYIPSVLNTWVKSGVKAPLIPTNEIWFGVTYAEDKPWVASQFNELHQNKRYPDNLWQK
ncbi:MAG: sugar phosphate nucleotidyltransferase [Cyclobacteriaceae bacterium]|nr:sugar phosphate nucleotidyltransferase [Cyclobacteriaceae bacterium]